jgi:hypothetical protein
MSTWTKNGKKINLKEGFLNFRTMKTSNFQKKFSDPSHTLAVKEKNTLSLTLFEKLSLVNPTN